MVEVGSKWGYIDKQGRLAIPLRFDWATPFSEGRALITVGVLNGYIDLAGNVVIAPQFPAGGHSGDFFLALGQFKF